jgi:hypothetical protein
LINEGEYHSDEEYESNFIIPIANKPVPDLDGQWEKQRLMMAASENIFSDNQMFIYNNVW